MPIPICTTCVLFRRKATLGRVKARLALMPKGRPFKKQSDRPKCGRCPHCPGRIMYEKVMGMVPDKGEQTLANRIAAQGMPSMPNGAVMDEDDDCICLTQMCDAMRRVKVETE
jgi:hypothetical protein